MTRNKNSGYLVLTTSGKKGVVKHAEIPKDKEEKLPVHVLNDAYEMTGEKLLCTRESLKTIGMYD
jgi:hypothetical protein